MRRALLPVIVTAVTGALLATPGLIPPAAAGPHPALSAVQVSADPYTNASAEHATQVEPDTMAVGHSVMSVFQVGRWDNGCSDDIGWAFSGDSGRTWRHGYLPGMTRFSRPAGPFVRASDPAIAYNAAFGEWIASALACNGTSPNPAAPVPSPAVMVSVSFDGVHWSRAVIVARVKRGQSYDKEWITCDNSPASRFFGRCYVEWDLPSGGQLVVMSTSADGGATWSPPATTASRLHGIGGEPVVQPDGTVVVPILGPGGLAVFRSTDGGRTWGTTIKAASIFQHSFAGNLRGPFFPSVAMDRAGRIYVSWPDCRFRASCSSNDMVLTTSADGVGWTRVARIPIDPVTSAVDHLGGGLGVDPSTAGGQARLGLFYDFYPRASCTVATCRMYVGFVSSADGGARWSAPQVLAGPWRLRQLPFAFGYMVGDYEGAAVVPGGNAFSAFAVAGIPSAGQRFSEAMYQPSGGAPITGGPLLASPAGAHPGFAPARMPAITRTR
jgi:hypothetical protein